MRRWHDGIGELLVEGREEAPVTLRIAASSRTRARGLLGRDGIDGAMLLTPCNSVHTFRMRFPIDVAYLDRGLRVLAVHTLRPGRLGMVRVRARHVLEAEAGSMAEWGVVPGVRVSVVVAGAAPGAARGRRKGRNQDSGPAC
ncbi:DUF192 domain-containing protein [Streptomyces sp. NPDC090026]|uniref:DUF192 domain-containing protein n=1 Tax=Streptomyces sp. NPDC090026 TaxID=3365923 RepID=UPI00380E5BE6